MLKLDGGSEDLCPLPPYFRIRTPTSRCMSVCLENLYTKETSKNIHTPLVSHFICATHYLQILLPM